MAEYRLPFTAKEIEEKLNKVEEPVSWNDLNDRPFCEEVVSLGDTLTWDGTPTDTAIGITAYTLLQRVSDSTPSVEELVGGSFVGSIIFNSTDGETVLNDHMKVELTSDNVLQVSENFIVLLNDGTPNVGIALEDGTILESEFGNFTFPKKGIYFLRSEDDQWDGIKGDFLIYISSLTAPNYNFIKTEIKKLDPKYLPEGIGYEETRTGEILIEYDGDSTGKLVVDTGEGMLLVKVSDLTPEPTELIGAVATVGGQSQTITADDIQDGRPEGMPGVAVGGGLLMICYGPIPAYGILEAGMYIVDMGVPASLKYTSTVTNIHKIDPKYLEFSKTKLIVDEIVTTEDEGDIDVVGEGLFANNFLLLSGKTYLVEFAGENYSCVARTVSENGRSATWIGRGKYFNGIDSGEPFSICNISGISQPCLNIYGIPDGDFRVKICEVDCAKIPKECLPDDIGGLPEVTEEDNGKVLGVDGGVWQKVEIEIPDPLPPILPENEGDALTVEDGTTVWKKPEKGISVTEIESPDDIKADSPDGFYIQEGGTSTPSGGTIIHYFDSLEQVPADLPDGSFVAVPSEGAGGGLPVVDIETAIPIDESTIDLSVSDNAKMDDMAATKAPFVGVFSVAGLAGTCVRVVLNYSYVMGVAQAGVSPVEFGDAYSGMFCETSTAFYIMVAKVDGKWVIGMRILDLVGLAGLLGGE